MITPGYGLTATERILPRLAIDFTSAVADARVTTTRANATATRTNSNGVIEIVGANLPRFDFDPNTLTCLGQLIEASRTNLFLNSLIDGTSLSTQNVTLAAVAYTLSFYGTGSITISGGHSATVVGDGAYPTRKTYTFTPTAGSSTFTVSGTVSFAQIEAGSFATSFIPTAGTSVQRNADAVTMTGTNFSSWYNASEGTIVTELAGTAALFGGVTFSDGTAANTIDLLSASSRATGTITVSTAGQFFSAPLAIVSKSINKYALAYKLNDTIFSASAVIGTQDTNCLVPTVNRAVIGFYPAASSYLNGHIKNLYFYPQRITNAETQAFSKK